MASLRLPISIIISRVRGQNIPDPVISVQVCPLADNPEIFLTGHIVVFEPVASGVLLLQKSHGSRRSIKSLNLIFVDDLPEDPWVASVRLPFIQQSRTSI